MDFNHLTTIHSANNFQFNKSFSYFFKIIFRGSNRGRGHEHSGNGGSAWGGSVSRGRGGRGSSRGTGCGSSGGRGSFTLQSRSNLPPSNRPGFLSAPKVSRIG